MNMHKELKDQATGILKTVTIPGLRGVIAEWEEPAETLSISFFFSSEPTEDQIEEASVATTYILAALPIINSVNEKFLVVELPKLLPKSDCWVFRSEDTGSDT